MSQHDMVVDNGPGAAVRIDMNTAIQALVTMNAGPLEPLIKYAGMLWLDTSVSPNGNLKMRDLSNSAWVFPQFYGDDRVGEIAHFARTSPPTGWLKANGVAVSRTTYSALFAVMGTTFGQGDGSTTFNLPDLRGQFMRAWDDGRGVDAARPFGSLQADAIENHVHPATTTVNAAGAHAHSGSTGTVSSDHTHAVSGNTGTESADHAHSTGIRAGQAGSAGVSAGSSSDSGVIATGGRNAAHYHFFSAGTGGISANHTHAFNTSTAADHAHTASTTVGNMTGGAAETRPTNVALLACIRYA
jgi:microcystin-dependent protein